MSEPRSAVLTLKRQPSAGAAVLVATLEDAWTAIRAQHPEVPAVQILVGQGSRQRGGPLLGYFAADRWQPAAHHGELVHELVIAGEGLALGAGDVFTTLLHEAAHALAVARTVSDTSRDVRVQVRVRFAGVSWFGGVVVERGAAARRCGADRAWGR